MERRDQDTSGGREAPAALAVADAVAVPPAAAAGRETASTDGGCTVSVATPLLLLEREEVQDAAESVHVQLSRSGSDGGVGTGTAAVCGCCSCCLLRAAGVSLRCGSALVHGADAADSGLHIMYARFSLDENIFGLTIFVLDDSYCSLLAAAADWNAQVPLPLQGPALSVDSTY